MLCHPIMHMALPRHGWKFHGWTTAVVASCCVAPSSLNDSLHRLSLLTFELKQNCSSVCENLEEIPLAMNKCFHFCALVEVTC